MLGMRISVQEYAAKALPEPTVKISINAPAALARWMMDEVMACPFVLVECRANKLASCGVSLRNWCGQPGPQQSAHHDFDVVELQTGSCMERDIESSFGQ